MLINSSNAVAREQLKWFDVLPELYTTRRALWRLANRGLAIICPCRLVEVTAGCIIGLPNSRVTGLLWRSN